MTGNIREGKIYARGLNKGTVTSADATGAFPAAGVAPGSTMIAEADAKVNQEIMKNFTDALREFTAVMGRQGVRNAVVGTLTIGSTPADAAAGRMVRGERDAGLTADESATYKYLLP